MIKIIANIKHCSIDCILWKLCIPRWRRWLWNWK